MQKKYGSSVVKDAVQPKMQCNRRDTVGVKKCGGRRDAVGPKKCDGGVDQKETGSEQALRIVLENETKENDDSESEDTNNNDIQATENNLVIRNGKDCEEIKNKKGQKLHQ